MSFLCVYLQQLKRKEKEHEQESQRLAKEKIDKEKKLDMLRHQMSTRFDNMHSTIQSPDNEGSNGIRERGLYSKQIKKRFVKFIFFADVRLRINLRL